MGKNLSSLHLSITSDIGLEQNPHTSSSLSRIYKNCEQLKMSTLQMQWELEVIHISRRNTYQRIGQGKVEMGKEKKINKRGEEKKRAKYDLQQTTNRIATASYEPST